MKVFICILAFALSAKAGLLPHHVDEHAHHFVDGPHFAGHADIHHAEGIHLGHSSAIVIDDSDHHHIEHPHPVFHHDDHHLHHDVIDVHHDAPLDVHHTPATKIVHHGAIHHVEPVHHVTKVVHHEPHHFLHYSNPVVDHHIVHSDHHIDEHAHANDVHPTDLHHHHHHIDGHHHGLIHHHTAPIALVRHVPVGHHHHHAHTHAAIVRKVYPDHPLHFHSAGDIMAFAKHQLHGNYGRVKITETHY